jgi:uncharacterized protein
MNQMTQISPSKDECNIAMLAHLLGIFTGFIGPLILWLIKKDAENFVADTTKEALNFQITLAIGYLICTVLAVVVIGAFLMPVLFLLNLIFCIMAAVSASKGDAYRYPFALRLIK